MRVSKASLTSRGTGKVLQFDFLFLLHLLALMSILLPFYTVLPTKGDIFPILWLPGVALSGVKYNSILEGWHCQGPASLFLYLYPFLCQSPASCCLDGLLLPWLTLPFLHSLECLNAVTSLFLLFVVPNQNNFKGHNCQCRDSGAESLECSLLGPYSLRSLEIIPTELPLPYCRRLAKVPTSSSEPLSPNGTA